VPGALRKLVSPDVTTGLAAAHAADSAVKMTADAATRAKLMAILFFLPSFRRAAPVI
jgi:hypothetical protein